MLARLAGPIERWPETLAPLAKLGYNMVHFTPIQPPGESGSCYSLDDQNAIDETLMEPSATSLSQVERLAKVEASVKALEKDHGMLAAMDIVLNHCAGTAPWLLDHPESAYSVGNSPHLKAAAELDEKLGWFSNELKSGRMGGPHINNHDDLNRVMDTLAREVIGPLKLWEYYQVDEAESLRSFKEANGNAPAFEHEDYNAFKDGCLPSLGANRTGAFVPASISKKYCRDEGQLTHFLGLLRNDLQSEFGSLESDIYGAIRGVITWERIECKKGPIGDGHLELVPRYFRRLKLTEEAQKRLGKEEEVVAHNGWVMGWPATEDFAAPSWRHVYMRRHLCAWGDCVKLRFGAEPKDCPFLWDHMTRYAVSMAKIFHAIRLDNAHSTPLHVSQHVLAKVREANPNCWIFAELFTGNFETDLLYQGTLGINALIREAMQCNSPGELANNLQGSLWGSHPIGAISHIPTLSRRPTQQADSGAGRGFTRSASFALISSGKLPLRPRGCPALLFDCTHDNQTPREKRDPRDALPNAALTAASCSSIGSVRGYDELFGENPSVVFERSWYKDISGVGNFTLNWPSLPIASPRKQASPETSPTAPEVLEVVWSSAVQQEVVARGEWDGWAKPLPLQKQPDGRWKATVPATAQALSLQYKFVVDGNWCCDHNQPTADDGKGNVNNVLRSKVNGDRPNTATNDPIDGPAVLTSSLPGIMAVKQVLNSVHTTLATNGFVELASQQLAEDIVVVQRRAPDTGRRTWFVTRSAFGRNGGDNLPEWTGTLCLPGRIAALHVAATLFVPYDQPARRESGGRLEGQQCHLHLFKSLQEVAYVWQEGRNTMLKLHHFPPGSILVFSTNPKHEKMLTDELENLLEPTMMASTLQGLTLSDLNYLLFSCESEELDRSKGQRGAYNLDGYGPLVYCGLLGICTALDLERLKNNDFVDGPILSNVRNGDWLLGYLTARLGDFPSLCKTKAWLESVLEILAQMPRDLVPFQFDRVVSELCCAACNELLKGSGEFLARGSTSSSLLQDLAVAAAQFWAATPSAPLHWDRAQKEGWLKVPSLAAGLPHFASGFMRNWGRDTFISLRGCLLLTNRFEEARDTLLVYASVVRHGLCPNLLDAANRPRYNARDATWFFMQAIQDYASMSPEGLDFLKAPVELKWPTKEWDATLPEPKCVADLMHTILQAHAKNIKFREWNAGSSIDEHMKDEGFNIEVKFEEETGLIYGGNEWNCGTWMDKMGSSEKAGNKGWPATPRDGAAVEIIGLLKSALRWVSSLDPAIFPYDSVKLASGKELSYKDWNSRLQASFETKFWIENGSGGYYKDTLGASRQWQDGQLRPNFPIAMAVAPELFSANKAQAALRTAERLIGPLGMCTLDPKDKEYRGDYHNDDDSCDKSVAHGWNYHQGPEWVWPMGFFLKAWHRFFPKGSGSGSDGRQEVLSKLLKHRAMLPANAWRSLPELTNSKGQVCHHSCPAQAWSIATLLDALHSMSTESTPSESTSPKKVTEESLTKAEAPPTAPTPPPAPAPTPVPAAAAAAAAAAAEAATATATAAATEETEASTNTTTTITTTTTTTPAAKAKDEEEEEEEKEKEKEKEKEEVEVEPAPKAVEAKPTKESTGKADKKRKGSK